MNIVISLLVDGEFTGTGFIVMLCVLFIDLFICVCVCEK